MSEKSERLIFDALTVLLSRHRYQGTFHDTRFTEWFEAWQNEVRALSDVKAQDLAQGT